MLLSLRQLCTTGGIGDRWSSELGEVPDLDPALPVSTFDGADQARVAVRRMVRAGADWIKVAATGSIMGQGSRHIQITREELAAIVDEAGLRDRGVMVHAHDARAAVMAAEVGARSVEHGIWLDEHAASVLARCGTTLVPTLSVTQHPGADVGSDVAAAHRVSFRRAVDAGVVIALGADNPVTPHSDVLFEIDAMAHAGLGAAGAFRAATLNAARLLGLDSDRGEIAAGKRADLVLLNGFDISTERLADRIKGVWHNGHRIR
jgi:imidazolonepropionase-like amidohydrolase